MILIGGAQCTIYRVLYNKECCPAKSGLPAQQAPQPADPPPEARDTVSADVHLSAAKQNHVLPLLSIKHLIQIMPLFLLSHRPEETRLKGLRELQCSPLDFLLSLLPHDPVLIPLDPGTPGLASLPPPNSLLLSTDMQDPSTEPPPTPCSERRESAQIE